MTDPSGSARFQSLFESALQAYEKKAGVTLTQHPLATHIQNCRSVDDVNTLLQGQAQAISDIQTSDRIARSMKKTLSILVPLSAAAILTLGLSSDPTKVIHAGFAILLSAPKGVLCSHGALADLLESIEQFISRLDVYTRIPLTNPMVEIVIKIILELLSILALATKELKQQKPIKFAKKHLGEKDVEAVLQRLDRLTQDEVRTTATQSLEVVYGLLQNMSLVMDDGKASIDEIRKVLEIMHQIANDMNKSNRDRLLKGIRKWLSPPGPKKNYDTALESRHNETGLWFINGNTLSEWKASGSNSLLWIHGKPGSGKSVLCSTIIEDIEPMRKSGLASLAMFYCDFREDQKKGVHGLLSSVLVQLCRQSSAYCAILSKLYEEHENGSENPSNDRLIRCLKDVLEVPRQAPIFLFVDALDECPNIPPLSSPRDRILSLLEGLVNAKLPNLRICVTSRPEVDIKAVLEPLSFYSFSLHDEPGQQEDIENYIKSVVNTNRNMRRWKPEHRQLVIDVLTARAEGMFRWAYCQLEYLGNCLPGRIRHVLEELPETLDATYERTLQEIDNTNWEFAQRLLLCVTVVSRPLRVEELAEVLAFDFDAGPIPEYHEDWQLEDPVEAVLSTCSTLLALVNVDNVQVIQFSHFSVREFLTSSRFAEKLGTLSKRYYISMTPAHTLVAQACLGALLHLDINITRDRLTKFPLATYASEHWFEHARFEGVSESVFEGMKQLFDKRKPHLTIWLWIRDPTVPFWGREEPAYKPVPPHGTPLHYAAFCGLLDVVKDLVTEQSEDINSQNFTIRGNIYRNHKLTPLHLASQEGHVEVAQLLVDHGADVARLDEDGRTPLHPASKNGHIELARLLVEHGADVATQNKRGYTPLHRASKGGHVELAQFLIEHGADVAARNERGQTPLHRACKRGHIEMARFLVEHGDDVEARDKLGETPLHQASERGRIEVAKFLVEHGAAAAVRDEGGRTPLHCVSICGHIELARFLVEHGADAAARDKDGQTPLHCASICGHIDVAKFLVEYGADAAARDKRRETPLHQASERGCIELARILVEHGASVAARDKHGRTPLHRASASGHTELARFLIENGADVAARNKHGQTPLHGASERGRIELARFLVERGADTAARDEHGLTPLHCASASGHLELAWFLVKYGEDVATRDERGQTPLHRASEGGHVQLARFLVEHGADAAAQDKRGLTPLHRASEGGHIELAKFLVEQGADATARAENGQTPLYRTSEGGHINLT